jgi:hypothetical protein
MDPDRRIIRGITPVRHRFGFDNRRGRDWHSVVGRCCSSHPFDAEAQDKDGDLSPEALDRQSSDFFHLYVSQLTFLSPQDDEDFTQENMWFWRGNEEETANGQL